MACCAHDSDDVIMFDEDEDLRKGVQRPYIWTQREENEYLDLLELEFDIAFESKCKNKYEKFFTLFDAYIDMFCVEPQRVARIPYMIERCRKWGKEGPPSNGTWTEDHLVRVCRITLTQLRVFVNETGIGEGKIVLDNGSVVYGHEAVAITLAVMASTAPDHNIAFIFGIDATVLCRVVQYIVARLVVIAKRKGSLLQEWVFKEIESGCGEKEILEKVGERGVGMAIVAFVDAKIHGIARPVRYTKHSFSSSFYLS